MRPGRDPVRARGQVLTLFALFLVMLLGMAALAIDVSSVLAARRFYRSVADAAALAGAQDLQQAGSRTITAAERIHARQDALANVTTTLGVAADPATCDTSTDADLTDACVLIGTTIHVAIKAGSTAGPPIACQTCDSDRSVQVSVRNANYAMSFTRLLGQIELERRGDLGRGTEGRQVVRRHHPAPARRRRDRRSTSGISRSPVAVRSRSRAATWAATRTWSTRAWDRRWSSIPGSRCSTTRSSRRTTILAGRRRCRPALRVRPRSSRSPTRATAIRS